jgi:hypothetical protein
MAEAEPWTFLARRFELFVSEDRPIASRFDSDLGLFVEEVTADLVRFERAAAAACTPDLVAVERERPLGRANCYADIRVALPKEPPFFVEVKLRYTAREIVGRVTHKYGPSANFAVPGERLALVVCRADYGDWPAIEDELRRAASSNPALEIWDEPDLLKRLRKTFADDIHNLTREELLEVRRAIERAYWRFAFDNKFAGHPSISTLQWHFSPWELHRLHREQGLTPEQILAPCVCHQKALSRARPHATLPPLVG